VVAEHAVRGEREIVRGDPDGQAFALLRYKRDVRVLANAGRH